jgi:hypothetical protein
MPDVDIYINYEIVPMSMWGWRRQKNPSTLWRYTPRRDTFMRTHTFAPPAFQYPNQFSSAQIFHEYTTFHLLTINDIIMWEGCSLHQFVGLSILNSDFPIAGVCAIHGFNDPLPSQQSVVISPTSEPIFHYIKCTDIYSWLMVGFHM